MIDIKRVNNSEKFREMIKKVSLKFPVAEIAAKTGYSKGSISEILKEKRSPTDEFLDKFCKAYDLDLKGFEEKSENEVNEPEEFYKKVETKGVPYYDIDFTASFLAIENTNQVTPDSYISHPFFKGCDYVVRASGQSMAKVICHGDAIGLIRINSWQDFFPFGEIYAIVTIDNFRMIKVITKGESEEYYTLISKPTDSKKEEFPPQQIKKSSISAIFRVQASSHLF